MEVLIADEKSLLGCAPLDLLPERTAKDVHGAFDANRVDVCSGNIPVHVLLAHHNIRMNHAVEHPPVEPVVCLFSAGGPRVEEPYGRIILVSDENDACRPANPAGVYR